MGATPHHDAGQRVVRVEDLMISLDHDRAPRAHWQVVAGLGRRQRSAGGLRTPGEAARAANQLAHRRCRLEA